jgi:hypothetical protein
MFFSSSHIHAYTLLMLFFSLYGKLYYFFCFAYTWNNYFNDVYWMSEMVGYPFISELLYFDSIICLFLFIHICVCFSIYELNCEYFHGTFRHSVANAWAFNSVMNMLCMFSFFSYRMSISRMRISTGKCGKLRISTEIEHHQFGLSSYSSISHNKKCVQFPSDLANCGWKNSI